MKMLISCVVLLCVAGAINGQAAGVACNNGACDANLVCESGTCKIKSGQDCTTPPENCLAGATCTGTPKKCTCGNTYIPKADANKCELKIGQGCSVTNDCLTGTTCTGTPKKCTCPEGNTPNDDSTKCELKIGQECSGKEKNCLTGAACTGDPKKCTCSDGKTPNDDNTKCSAASASAVASVLLMVAAFLSSRWM